MNRVLLFGADGHTPIAIESDQDGEAEGRLKAILVECFGAMMGLQVRTKEWPDPKTGIEHLLRAVVAEVGRERLQARYEKAGLEIRTPEETQAQQQAEVEKVKRAAEQAQPNVGMPYRAIPGGRA